MVVSTAKIYHKICKNVTTAFFKVGLCMTFPNDKKTQQFVLSRCDSKNCEINRDLICYKKFFNCSMWIKPPRPHVSRLYFRVLTSQKLVSQTFCLGHLSIKETVEVGMYYWTNPTRPDVNAILTIRG